MNDHLTPAMEGRETTGQTPHRGGQGQPVTAAARTASPRSGRAAAQTTLPAQPPDRCGAGRVQTTGRPVITLSPQNPGLDTGAGGRAEPPVPPFGWLAVKSRRRNAAVARAARTEQAEDRFGLFVAARRTREVWQAASDLHMSERHAWRLEARRLRERADATA